MNKWLKRLIVSVCTIGLIIMIGCSAVQDAITPAYILPEAAVYADVNDTSEFMPYTTLWDLNNLDRRLDFAHQANQNVLGRMLEDDNLEYAFLKDAVTTSQQSAAAFKETVFSPSGPIGLMFPAVFGGLLGTFLIKRPGDKTKEEFETAVNNNAKV